MKHRILFMGNDKAMISDMFDLLSEEFELMTTSIRYRDIDSHLKIFKPKMYVYCLNDARVEDIKHISELRSYMLHEGVEVAIIGSANECETFQDMTGNMAGLVIKTPAAGKEIAASLEAFARKSASQQEDVVDGERRKHILVIDDDPQMLRVIKEMLHDKYDVATAVSGRVAFKFLEKRKTDMILLDYEMPEENGLEVLRKLRADIELAEIPVMFLTGNTDRDKIKEAVSLNPQGYLVKPINNTILVDSIRNLIG